jgi:hypothetical protein
VQASLVHRAHFAAAVHCAAAAHPASVVHVVQVLAHAARHASAVEWHLFRQLGEPHPETQSDSVELHGAAHAVASLKQLAWGVHGVVSTEASAPSEPMESLDASPCALDWN